jgi:hypothetical protein
MTLSPIQLMLSSVVFSMPIPTQVCPPLSEFYKVVKPLVKREVPFIELIASWHFYLKAKKFVESLWQWHPTLWTSHAMYRALLDATYVECMAT